MHVPESQILEGSMPLNNNGLMNPEFFNRQTSYLGFLSLKFIEKQTKSILKLARIHRTHIRMESMSVVTQPMSDSGVLLPI